MVKLLFTLLILGGAAAYEDTCTPFKDIYKDGTELCEVMWDNAFTVVDDSEPGYNFWFFDAANNPNDDVTRELLGETVVADQCHLNYFHKEGAPSPEGDDMQECHPWKNNGCCHSDTVGSVDAINEAYGPGYEWDRCGPMSQACERFFVMEACFYECEPAAGLFRKHKANATNKPDNYNEWQLENMPIKKSFCDGWYTACYDDYFCGKGSYFECSAHYRTNLAAQEAAAKEGSGTNTGLVVGLTVGFALAALAIMAAFYLVYKEKKGVPVFSPAEIQGGVST